MDRISKERRSLLMSHVRSKDSLIELTLRKALWSKGYRYRKHVRGLPGTPDIVLTKYKIAIFVDSEFWHGHEWESRKHRIGTNREFWVEKIEATIERDKRSNQQLQKLGWRVIRFWGAEIRKNLPGCVLHVEAEMGLASSSTLLLVAEGRKSYVGNGVL